MSAAHTAGPVGSDDSAFRDPRSVFRAFAVLVVQSAQRHWRMRQMGFVAAGLLGIVLIWVGFATQNGAWDIANQKMRVQGKKRDERPTFSQEAERLGRDARYSALMEDANSSGERLAAMPAHEVPNPLNPTADALKTLVLSAPQAVMRSDPYLRSWAFMNYSRFVILLVFMGFVLPLFT
ncbi:MAG: hypothetical protein K2V38_02685, partial [Gemmataceae bacterium]|nr:hypothetical protein [Gemmataceae bacterium]